MHGGSGAARPKIGKLPGHPPRVGTVHTTVSAQQRTAPKVEMLTCYSANTVPEPPISFGMSFIFGKPSLIRSTVSW